MIAPQSGEIAVDVMCDSGIGADALAKTGALVTAVDTDAAVVASAATQARRAVTVTHIPDGVLPFADSTVSAVISLFTIGLAPAPAGMLEEVGRVLAPGGRAALAVWDPDNSAESLLHSVWADAGIPCPFLDALVAPRLEGGVSWLSEQSLRDVARFDGIDHFWLGMVQRRPLIDSIIGLDLARRDALKTRCVEMLAPYTGADGTMRIPVTARVWTTQ